MENSKEKLTGEELKDRLMAQKRTPKICRLSLQAIEQLVEIVDLYADRRVVSLQQAREIYGQQNANVEKSKVNKKKIAQYLDAAIRSWRKAKEPFAKYYVDAFQSVRMSLLGELLPKEDGLEVEDNIKKSFVFENEGNDGE